MTRRKSGATLGVSSGNTIETTRSPAVIGEESIEANHVLDDRKEQSQCALPMSSTSCSNDEMQTLHPSVNCDCWVRDEKEVLEFKPRRRELFQLAKAWAFVHLSHQWHRFVFGVVDGVGDSYAASDRIATLEAHIGREAIEQALAEAVTEARAKIDDSRRWNAFWSDKEEGWRAEFERIVEENVIWLRQIERDLFAEYQHFDRPNANAGQQETDLAAQWDGLAELNGVIDAAYSFQEPRISTQEFW